MNTLTSNANRKGMLSTKFVEWFTPVEILDAAREVLGKIDLDPASCPEANETVEAVKFFDKEQDGLKHQWFGRVWLNPPFGLTENNKSSQAVWSQKLSEEYESGRVTEAILLVNASMGYHWTQPLLKYPTCFTKGRLKFRLPTGEKSTLNPVGSMIVYFGKHPYSFTREFSKFGIICREAMYK